MVTITLEDRELAQLVGLVNRVVKDSEQKIAAAASSREPNPKAQRDHLHREYEQAQRLASQLSASYQNRDQA
ncbi:MAG TPA: hypothetical protein VF707_01915 [Ardenticatenaceae bacterium]|jgi:hypothetical protein